MNTINNSIPFVPENTTDPAAGLNLSLNQIDALLQVRVHTVGENAPPTGVEGQRHIVGTAPTGVWAGQANKLARYLDGAWTFYDARIVLGVDGVLYVRPDAYWVAFESGGAEWGGIGGLLEDQADLADALAGKVDKITGKGLSTEDYTTAEKTKLGELPTNEALTTTLSGKQDALVSGTNVKTLNGESLLGSGNIATWDNLLTPAISSGTLTLNLANPAGFAVTLNANITTLAFSNVPAGKFVVFAVAFKQDATGGRTITWPAAVQGAPVQPNPAPNALTIMSFATWDGTTFYQAV